MDSKDVMRVVTQLESTERKTYEDVSKLIRQEFSQGGRDAWLLQGLMSVYFTTNSCRILKEIKSIVEPYHKVLLDKLLDFLKSGQHKLDALYLLSQIVLHQPPWLHTIPNHSIMNQLIKLMKNETNVPALTIAILTLVALVPAIPISIGPFLPDIFFLLVRFAGLKMRLGAENADSIMMMFHIAIYSMFHRFYGLYPCNMLTQLRTLCARSENMVPFENVLKPMLLHVKMHPLLITSNQSNELKPQRFKSKEYHDIVLDCSNLSLDISEGSAEQLYCPLITQEMICEKAIAAIALDSDVTESVDEIITALPPGVKASMIRDTQVSHASGIGEASMLMNPDNIRKTLYSPGSGSQRTDSVSGRSSVQTPSSAITPRLGIDSPIFIRDHLDKNSQRFFTSDTSQSTGLSIAERRSANLSLGRSDHAATVISPLRSVSASHEGSSMVPPSPMKPDFSSEPPLGMVPLKAVRKLDMQSSSSSAPKLATQKVEKKSASKPAADEPSHAIHSPIPIKSDPSSSRFGPPSRSQPIPAASQSVPTLRELPNIVSSLERECGDDEDEEVSQITTDEVSGPQHEDSTSDGESSLEMDPEFRKQSFLSVKSCVQSYNRTRFNSMHATMQPHHRHKNRPLKRPTSCPSLELQKASAKTLVNKETNTEVTMMDEQRGVQNVCLKCQALLDGQSKSIQDPSGVEKLDESVDNERTSSMDDNSEVENVEEIRKKIESYKKMLLLPPEFVDVLRMSLPFGHISENKNPPLRDNKALMLAESPYLKLKKHLSADDLLFNDGYLLRTYGYERIREHQGLVNDLCASLRLVNHLLLIERKKREYVVLRNRRLLKSISNNLQLQEEIEAMKYQLRLQRYEHNQLKDSVIETHQYTNKQIKAKRVEIEELQETIRSQRKEHNELTEQMQKLRSDYTDLNLINASLRMENQEVRASEFELKNNLHFANIAAKDVDIYREKVSKLQIELLLMSELQQKYQQRLQQLSTFGCKGVEKELLLNAWKEEVKETKRKVNHLTVQNDGMHQRLADCEENIKLKDHQIKDLRQELDSVIGCHEETMKSLKDKYESSQEQQLAFHQHTMVLQGELNDLAEEQRNIRIPASIRGTRYREEPNLSISDSSEVMADDSMMFSMSTSTATPSPSKDQFKNLPM